MKMPTLGVGIYFFPRVATGIKRAHLRRSHSAKNAYAVAALVRFCWKHSRHNTGRPCVGLNGTVVSLPHPEQVVRVSTLAWPALPPLAPATRWVLHALQRLGSFLNCLS